MKVECEVEVKATHHGAALLKDDELTVELLLNVYDDADEDKTEFLSRYTQPSLLYYAHTAALCSHCCTVHILLYYAHTAALLSYCCTVLILLHYALTTALCSYFTVYRHDMSLALEPMICRNGKLASLKLIVDTEDSIILDRDEFEITLQNWVATVPSIPPLDAPVPLANEFDLVTSLSFLSQICTNIERSLILRVDLRLPCCLAPLIYPLVIEFSFSSVSSRQLHIEKGSNPHQQFFS